MSDEELRALRRSAAAGGVPERVALAEAERRMGLPPLPGCGHPMPFHDAVALAWEAFVARGGRRGLVLLDAGMRKATALAMIVRRTGRALWLVRQPSGAGFLARSLRDAWPDAEVGVVIGSRSEPEARDAVIASAHVADLRLREIGHFDIVIVDPAKTVASKSSKIVADLVRARPELLVLGVDRCASVRRHVRSDLGRDHELARFPYPFEKLVFRLDSEDCVEVAEKSVGHAPGSARYRRLVARALALGTRGLR